MIVIAHNIRSLHNVGAIFRSADAFGVEKIFLTGYTGTPPRKEIAKVALGSEHHLPWEHVEDAQKVIKGLQDEGVRVLALENGVDAVPIQESGVDPEKTALLLGNEVKGVEEALLDIVDRTVEIPMPGRKQSLNVSVATGVALYALMIETP
jgi:tRNA G18 (ribose-2'-O)-methylase SpoU